MAYEYVSTVTNSGSLLLINTDMSGLIIDLIMNCAYVPLLAS
jgi:hypothetical protein